MAGDVLDSGFVRADDGVELYYRCVGSGPLMVCCNGVGVSTFFWKYLAAHMQDRYRVVLWDYRGHGRSAVPPSPATADLSVQRHAKDLALLIEAHGGGPAILLGHSMGCQVILEYAVHVAEPLALIAMFGTYGLPLDTLFDTALSRQVFRLARRASLLTGRRGMRLLRPLVGNPLAYSISRRTGLVHRSSASRSDIYMYLEHLNHMDMRVFMRTLHQLSEHDLEAELGAIHAPTLVMAGERDLFTPLHRSTRMAELIEGAELEVLPEGSHAAIVEQPELINRRIDRFLAERLGRRP